MRRRWACPNPLSRMRRQRAMSLSLLSICVGLIWAHRALVVKAMAGFLAQLKSVEFVCSQCHNLLSTSFEVWAWQHDQVEVKKAWHRLSCIAPVPEKSMAMALPAPLGFWFTMELVTDGNAMELVNGLVNCLVNGLVNGRYDRWRILAFRWEIHHQDAVELAKVREEKAQPPESYEPPESYAYATIYHWW